MIGSTAWILADQLRGKGNYDKAAKVFYSGDSSVSLDIARCYIARGDRPAAEAAFEKAIDMGAPGTDQELSGRRKVLLYKHLIELF